MMATAPTRSTLLIALLVSALSACAVEQQDEGTGITLDTDDQKTVYAMGVRLGRNIDQLPLGEAERAILEAGFADGIHGREPQVDIDRYGSMAEGLVARRTADRAKPEREAGEAFLAEAAAAEGAERSDSGMVMLALRPGDGPSPGPTDRVKVHYHGTLRDGTVFDSSVNRGEPVVFPLNGVIRCWTEALQKMQVGGKSRITCPADIAYGNRGAPPLIKPGAALAFEVELLEIVE
jgi:FKBP-type peptidyl-prolyl cis-trans isomerase